MDITSLSMMASMGNVQNQAGLMIMKKAMDTNQQSSQSMMTLLAATPTLSPAHLGQTIDISV